MNMTGMALGAVSGGTDAASLVLRLVLLPSTAVAAGAALLRPLVPRTTRRMVLLVATAGLVAAAADVLSLVLLPISVPVAVAQLLLTLALPALLAWRGAAACCGALLTLLLLAETALDHSGVAFAADTLCVLGTVGWLGLTVLRLTAGPQEWRTRLRPGPAAWVAGAGLVVAGSARIGFAGIGFDRRLTGTGFGVVLLLAAVLPLVLVGLVAGLARTARGRRAVYPAGALVVAAAFLAWSALGALPEPGPLPRPGVPLLTQVSVAGERLPVLVSPQRPGRNLVHLPEPGAPGAELTVTAAGGRSVPVTTRAGADGRWAEVTLPPGRSRLVLAHGRQRATVEVDTGSAPGATARAAGPDGPECASAALGGLLAGARRVLNACPSDALSASDADALRKVVGYLRDHGVTALTVAGDGSPRSDRAEQTVRDSAAHAHIRVNRLRGTDVARARNTKGALVVVSGWADAASRLYTISEEQAAHPHFGAGLYLAPWLVHAPVVNSALTSFLPLRFNPRDGASVSYAITLARGFHGETPSAAGFAQWSAAHRQRPDEGDALLYACAQVNVMPMEPMAATDDGDGGAGMGGDAAGMGHDMAGMDMGRSTPSPMDMGMGGGSYPGQWITGGTIVPITGPLPAAP